MRRLSILLILSVLALAGMSSVGARPLTVFAAASLKGALDEAAAAYTRTTGVPVRIAYAGTPALARQIGQGAPADVFVSADAAWMDHLERAGRIDPRTRRDILGNALVVIAPAAARAQERPAAGTLAAALGRDGRIALAATATVPGGRYARAALERSGLWRALQPRVVEAENVRAALQLVARGEATRGIVYASDARAEPHVRVLAAVPPSLHPRIVYPAARLRTSRHPQAAAFVGWLGGPPAQAVFRRHGFSAP